MARPRNSAPCSSLIYCLERDFAHPGMRRAQPFVHRRCLVRTVCPIAIVRNLPAPKLPAVDFQAKAKGTRRKRSQIGASRPKRFSHVNRGMQALLDDTGDSAKVRFVKNFDNK